MNGKRAKQLRRIVRANEAPDAGQRGSPYQAYHVVRRKGAVVVTNPNHEHFGETIAVDFPRIELHPGCEKKAIKNLKKHLKGVRLVKRD